jgi:hypothetical protein
MAAEYIAAGAEALNALNGLLGGSESKPEGTNILAVGENQAAQASPEQQALLEQLLAALSGQVAQSQQAMPSSLSLNALVQGRPHVQQTRWNEELAFGGLEQAGEAALSRVTNTMQERGLGNSGLVGSAVNNLIRPEVAKASQTFAALQKADMERMQRLRENEMKMNLAMSNSAMPLLNMLQQLQMFEATKYQGNYTRLAGDRYKMPSGSDYALQPWLLDENGNPINDGGGGGYGGGNVDSGAAYPIRPTRPKQQSGSRSDGWTAY